MGNTVKPRAWLPAATSQTYATSCLRGLRKRMTQPLLSPGIRHPFQELVMTQRVNHVEQSPELFKQFVGFLNAKSVPGASDKVFGLDKAKLA